MNEKHTYDTVRLPAAADGNGKPVVVVASAELMKCHLQQPPLNIGKDREVDIEVAQDSQGRPMIFHVDPDRHLKLLRQDELSPTGWHACELWGNGADGDKVTAFDISQDRHGRISIVLAAMRKDGVGSDVYFAPMLANDATSDICKDFATNRRKVSGIDPTFRAEAIIQGFSDDGKAPDVVISGVIGNRKSYYVIADPAMPARQLELPENADSDRKDLRIVLSHVRGYRMATFLYGLGDSQSLVGEAIYEQPKISVDYSANNNVLGALGGLHYTCIAAAPRRSGAIGSDLYVGAREGVYIFVNGSNLAFQKVAEKIGAVAEITVAEEGDHISVWALCENKHLYYILGRRGKTIEWNAPILFSASALHIAAMRSSQRKGNEVFVVENDFNIAHHWQDPHSTLWQRASLNLRDSGRLAETETFITWLAFEDETGKELANEEMLVTASDWTYVTANGRVYCLDKQHPVKMTTDFQGKLTVIIPTKDISAPDLYITPLRSGTTMTVRPNAKIAAALAKIRTGTDLGAARTADGESVVTGMTLDRLDGAAKQLAAVRGAISNTHRTSHTFISIDDRQSDKLVVPDGTSLAMTRRNGAWHTDSYGVAAGPCNVFNGIVVTIGDALHHIETVFNAGIEKIKDGARFVFQKVKDGVRFLIELGGKVLDLVLDTLGAAYKALNWLLKEIGIDLEKIVNWLGYVFSWSDIWKAHLVLAALVEGGVEFACDRLDKALDSTKRQAGKALDELSAYIRQVALPDKHKTLSISRGKASSGGGGDAKSLPALNYVGYQIQHGGLLNQSGKDTALDPADEAWEAVKTLFSSLAGHLKDKVDIFRKIANEPFSLQTLLEICVELVDLLIQGAKAITHLVIDLIKALLHAVRDMLIKPIKMPLLTDLYQWLGKLAGAEPNATELTAVRAFSLIVAIPMTVVCKIATGHPPFAGIPELETPDVARRFLPTLYVMAEQHTGSGASSGSRALRISGADPWLVQDEWICRRLPRRGIESASGAWQDDDPRSRPIRRHIAFISAGHMTAAGAMTNSPSTYQRLRGIYVKYLNGIVAPFASSIQTWCSVAPKVMADPQNAGPQGVVTFGAIKLACSFPFPKDGNFGTWSFWGYFFGWWGSVGTVCTYHQTIADMDGGVLRGWCKAGTSAISLVGRGIANVADDADAETWIMDGLTTGGNLASGIGAGMQEPILNYGGQGLAAIPTVYRISRFAWNTLEEMVTMGYY